MATFAVLAPPGPHGSEDESRTGIGPGLLAFRSWSCWRVATFLLIRSMLHHVKKVPPTFETEEPAGPRGPLRS